ncbi:MAG: hypothetical protein NZZ41_07130, partial [Candidatus Dojkabacteria bacterium]|nr:hypothetical protein [Candidatus Dojkabacteria bacterium]
MSCAQDPRNITGIYTTPMRKFSTLGPWPSDFINRPLMGNYGTYTVYPIFIPSENVNINYKMYLVTLNITNMPPGSLTQNPLPQPYIASKLAIFGQNGIYNDINWYNVTVTTGGSSFVFRHQENSTQPIVNSKVSFVLL